MTNKEIAQSLFVTLRAVEMHLSNVYAKLGVRPGKVCARLSPAPIRRRGSPLVRGT